MKKAIPLILAAALLGGGVWTILTLRQAAYNDGKAVGYLTGYTMAISGLPEKDGRSSQQLAGDIVPYETGGSKWKGFMMGFPEGWEDGRAAAEK